MLQELEAPYAGDLTVNDAFRPLSRYFDRVNRAEQLPSALLSAMRVLTDPAETGAVTVALPQDVQAEALRLAGRAVRRPHLARGPAAGRGRPDRGGRRGDPRRARRPMVVAGGGVHYSGAEEALQALCEATGIPVGESQAGKGSLPHGHPQEMGAVGSTGTTAANALARDADVVIGIGTRWSDFTTASRTAFQAVGRALRQHQHRQLRRRQARRAVRRRRRPRGAHRADRARWPGYAVDDALPRRAGRPVAAWDAQVEAAYHPPASVTDELADGLLTQGAVLGCVNELSDPRDVVLCAAGLDARRPAQAVAGARPQGLPRRVRLLLHGLRGAGLPRASGSPTRPATCSRWSATAAT